jgi:hypothetical protein
VEPRVQTLLEAEDNDPPEKIRPCDLMKIISSLKLRQACGIDGVPNALGTFQENPYCTSHI